MGTPGAPAVLSKLAALKEKQQRFSEAAFYYKRAQGTAPEDPVYLNRLAIVLAKNKKIEEAIVILEKLEKLLLTKAGEEVLKVEKVRLVDRQPFSHVVNYLPAEIGKRINLKKIKAEPILLILEDELGISVSNAVQTIEAALADIEIAPHLDVQVGDPLMKVERTVFGVDGQPIEFVSVLYRADKYCFTVKLERNKSDESEGWSTAR